MTVESQQTRGTQLGRGKRNHWFFGGKLDRQSFLRQEEHLQVQVNSKVWRPVAYLYSEVESLQLVFGKGDFIVSCHTSLLRTLKRTLKPLPRTDLIFT